jgi:CRP/FNR family transcriptional regulator, cyclic AMP receptor protein
MGSTVPVRQAASLTELLRTSAWAKDLTSEQLARIGSRMIERAVPAGGYICRKGEPVEHWIGIIDGLAKMTTVAASGKSTTFTGLPAQAWFGEGSLLKDEPRRYDVIALRNSRVAYMPRATFAWLLDSSIAFNRFLLVQLNERLGQFIGLVEHDRLLDPDARVARCLASLFNPHLYPGVGPELMISQEEIGYLCGVSRQRVNQALKVLEKAGLLRVDYGGVTIVDLAGMRNFGA